MSTFSGDDQSWRTGMSEKTVLAGLLSEVGMDGSGHAGAERHGLMVNSLRTMLQPLSADLQGRGVGLYRFGRKAPASQQPPPQNPRNKLP